jgi:adenine-specific DNA-methyltransferase
LPNAAVLHLSVESGDVFHHFIENLKGIKNKSISASVTRYSRFPHRKMEDYHDKWIYAICLDRSIPRYADALPSAICGGDYHIYPEHLRNLPVPLVPPSDQRPAVALVDKIIAAKAADPQADTTGIERQIDNLVYRLYSLTYEEVKVIEPGLPLGRAEYEGIGV